MQQEVVHPPLAAQVCLYYILTKTFSNCFAQHKRERAASPAPHHHQPTTSALLHANVRGPHHWPLTITNPPPPPSRTNPAPITTFTRPTTTTSFIRPTTT